MANTRRVVLLCATFILLTGRVLGDDDFDLSDALSFEATTKPWDFDLSDLLDFDTPSDKQTTTKAPQRTTTTRAPKKAVGDDDFSLSDLLKTTASPRKTTKSPKTTKKPRKKGNSDTSDFGSDFDLSDALDDSNDNYGKGGKGDSGTAGISDKDLEDLLGGGDYKPDKKKSGDDAPSNDQDQGNLNQQYVKGENAEAGTVTEPQGFI